MTDTREFLVETVEAVQSWFRTRKHPVSPERWFGTLALENVTVADGVATFIWRDPADGQRYGWRYACRTRGEVEAVDWRLVEEVDTTVPTEPDAYGVRWVGVVDEDGHPVPLAVRP